MHSRKYQMHLTFLSNACDILSNAFDKMENKLDKIFDISINCNFFLSRQNKFEKI